MRIILLLFCCPGMVVDGFVDIQEVMSDRMLGLPEDFALAVKDIAQGLPTKAVTIVRGNSTSIRYFQPTS